MPLRTHPQFLIRALSSLLSHITQFLVHSLPFCLFGKGCGIDLKCVQCSWRKGPGDRHTCRENSSPVLESDVNTSSLTTGSFEYINTEQETRDQARRKSLIRGEASFHLVIYPFHRLRLRSSSGSRHANCFSAIRKNEIFQCLYNICVPLVLCRDKIHTHTHTHTHTYIYHIYIYIYIYIY